jgi:hypothetical protein
VGYSGVIAWKYWHSVDIVDESNILVAHNIHKRLEQTCYVCNELRKWGFEGLKIRVSTVQFRPPAPLPISRPTGIPEELSL